MNSERVLDGPRMPNPLHWDRELSLTQEALAASRPDLAPKNVPLAECFNASKENGNDEDNESAVHA